MKISIIGSGRVGLSLGAVMAQAGLKVLMTDKDYEKKEAVLNGLLPFYEPDLENSLKNNQVEWTRYTEKILSADFIFLCLSTPLDKQGELDLKEVLNWAHLIADSAKKEKFLIIKSAFPVGTARQIHNIAREKKSKLEVIACPEFLRQGQALKDLSYPQRLVIGARTLKAGKKLEDIYKKFSKPKQFIHTDLETAELGKLACNSFLTVKISFINEMAVLCESLKGDIKKLQQILGSDKRIGPYFLNPGLGFGGYCLPKDLQMSLLEGKKFKQSLRLLKSAQIVNQEITKSFFKKIQEHYKNLKNIPLAFWGISFKKKTDDLKNSPALDLLCQLLKAGVELSVYDPLFVGEKVSLFFDKKRIQKLYSPQNRDQILLLRQKILSGKVFFHPSARESLNNKRGLIIGADHQEFQKIPLSEIKKRLKEPFMADGRHLFPAEDLKKEGFSFYQRGCHFTQK